MAKATETPIASDSEDPKSKQVRARRAPTVTITVGKQHIEQGIRRSSSHCMVSDAIKQALPNAFNVTTDLQTIRWTDQTAEVRYIYLTPRPAQLALIDFDRGIAPEPFSIRLSGGQVVRAAKKHRKRINLDQAREEWKPLRAEYAAEIKASGQSNEVIAAKLSIPTASLKRYLSPDAKVVPSDKTLAKLQAWRSGEPLPEPTAKEAASLAAAGSPRTRKGENAGSAPSVVGGHAPPVGNLAKARGFGLRQMVR